MKKVVEGFPMGHPDKVCDQVADAILDEFLRRDADSRADIEVFGGHGAMMISGCVESRADFDCAEIAKRVYKDAGYTDEIEPFVHLGATSLEVNGGARDQVVCYGYATSRTREMLPPAVVYAQQLARTLDEARQHDGQMNWMRPDGRVLVVTDGNDVTHVSVFAQHAKGATVQQVHGGILDRVIKPTIGSTEGVKLFVNPAGNMVEGGLSCNAGQSGRRSASDLYGGLIPHGSASLSGKDPQHPARAGHYMARHIAKSLVKAGKATQCLVTLVYTLGRSEPIVVEATGDRGEDLTGLLSQHFSLDLASIVKQFDLKKPMYRRLSLYGQVGHEHLPWEQVTQIKGQQG